MADLEGALREHHGCAPKVVARLNHMSVGSVRCQQAVKNFYLEKQAPSQAWATLVFKLCHADLDASKLRQTCTDVFRRFTLCGESIELTGHVLGRVMRYDKLVALLREQMEGDLTEDDARQSAQRLLSPDVAMVIAEFGSLQIGRHCAWSTFQVGSDRPFEGYDSSPRSLQSNLGMSDDKPDMAVVTFEYRLTPGKETRFPTIADACAGDEWSHYFCPALPGESAGQTMPWHSVPGAVKRAEVVHRPPSISELVRPVALKF